MFDIINYFAYAFFIFALSYYFITNLQWYSYKLNRVFFHHTKGWWNVVYFVLPFLLYMVVHTQSDYSFVVVFIYSGLLYQWFLSLDKPLVLTGRVKRFYVTLIFITLFTTLILKLYLILMPLFMAYFISSFFEMILFSGFKNQAIKKIESMENLKIIGITASYGKTSIKNYIEHLLKAKYKTYATPRSVNTLGGVMKDINDDLPLDTQVYVVEMGARGEGDIEEITTFVNPHFVVVGKIGPAHIEYFKSLENIRNTKMEILKSQRLEKAWIHESAMVKAQEHVHTFGDKSYLDIQNKVEAPQFILEEISCTLDGISFVFEGCRYHASILGAFNAMNLAAAVLVAKELGLTQTQIQEGLSSLEAVPHRLQRLEAGGKIILDDSFNGNIDGMMASFDLASTHKGRKVVITPGLVEVDDEFNIEVAKRANEVFDLIVVTGDLNYDIFKTYIDEEKLYKLSSKDKMQEMLVEKTTVGDLILFANDAPSFV